MASISTNHPDIVVTLAAGEVLRIPRRGRAYHCISITTDDGSVKVGMGYEPKESLRVGMGQVLHSAAPDFEYLKFDNTSAGAQTIVVATSDGTIVDNRFTLVGGVVPVSEGSPNTFDSEANQAIGATSHYDIAADATRREIIIYNNDATNLVWVRDQSGTSTEGVPVPPKGVTVLKTSGALRIRNPNGAGVTVSIAHIKQV